MQSAIIVCALACWVGIAQSRGPETAPQTGGRPAVELSLVSPLQPWPQIATDIGELEGAQERFEAKMMGEVQAAAQSAMTHVDQQVRVITDHLLRYFEDPALDKALAIGLRQRKKRTVSFLSRRFGDKLHENTVTVKVLKELVAANTSAINSRIHAIEQGRRDAEAKFFHQAAAEMDQLACSFIDEFQAQVDTQVRALLSQLPAALRADRTSFLQLPKRKQASIQVVESDFQYPTIEMMVSDMEQRRDSVENLVCKIAGLQSYYGVS